MKGNRCSGTCYRHKKGCLVKGRKNHLYIAEGNMTLHVVPHQVSQEPLWLWQDVFFGAAVKTFFQCIAPAPTPTHSLDESVHKTGGWAHTHESEWDAGDKPRIHSDNYKSQPPHRVPHATLARHPQMTAPSMLPPRAPEEQTQA